MSVKVMGEKLADTRSKVSLASSDRLRLDACALFGEAAATAVVAAPRCYPFRVSFLTYHYHHEAAKVHCELTILINSIPLLNACGHYLLRAQFVLVSAKFQR